MSNKRYLLIIFIIIGLILFLGDEQSRLNKANFLSKTVFYPFVVSLQEFTTISILKEKNQNLQIQMANLLIENNYLKSSVRKLQSNNIDFPIKENTFIMADVIGFSGSYGANTIVINKGLKDGLKNDYAVFSSKGITGKIVMAYQNCSILLPLNHPRFKCAIFDQNSQIQGILETDIYGKPYISFVKIGSSISIGDSLVTSNISQIFPAGFPVGTIESLEESQDALYIKGYIKPYTNFNNLEYVFVLIPSRKENYEGIIETNY